MPIITSELVANAAGVLVSNSSLVTNATANAVRVSLGGLALPTAYGSQNPTESVQVDVYVGAAGLSNDALLLSQTALISNGVWTTDLLVSPRGIVASNLQIAAMMVDPVLTLSAPTTNGVINIANTGNKVSVYVAAVGGGSNGSVTVSTGAITNVA